MEIFIKYFLLFLIYSFIGWSIEVFVTYINTKKIVDRGFLLGPYCPIYGWGGVLMTIFLTRYQDNIILLFIMSVIICGILEYFTSYFMEKIFNARWWDYSDKKINLHGRVCADTLIPFGLLGMFVICFLNPFLFKILSLIPDILIIVLFVGLLIVFIVDNIISFIIIFNLSGTIKKVSLDNTEEITEKVKEVIKEKSIIYRRLVKAFPNLKVWQKK